MTGGSCDECGQATKHRESRRCRQCVDNEKRRNAGPCGTVAAYKRHRKRGEDACAACKAANAKHVARKSPSNDPALHRGVWAQLWSRVALPDGNGCMLWLGSKSSGGYGSLIIDKRVTLAHRAALIYAEGPPPVDRPHAAHGCRNKHCVAPDHLRWATHVENMADKRSDGTNLNGEANHRARLTESQVLEIRTRHDAGGITQANLAREYGVSPSRISMIVNRRQWKHLEDAQ